MSADSHDPLVRVLFRLMSDEVPAGAVERAISSARIMTDVPETGIGALACEFAQRIGAMSEPATPPES